MKHSKSITFLLLGMFLASQLIGLAVLSAYKPIVEEIETPEGIKNITSYNFPPGVDIPQQNNPSVTITTLIIAFIFVLALMALFMNIKAELILRLWFFIVVSIALTISLYAGLRYFLPHSALIALLTGVLLAYLKIFKRNIILHNLTELFIYPGIAALFVPLLTVWTTAILLIIISVYDMYAVWHAQFMQKMAKYQIQTLRIFTGFFVPYLSRKDRLALRKNKKKKVKVSIALLGGGDVVFPIILAGVVMNAFSFLYALLIPIGALFGLAVLFHISEKGKFYPAMPFITAGCFVALGIIYLIS